MSGQHAISFVSKKDEDGLRIRSNCKTRGGTQLALSPEISADIVTDDQASGEEKPENTVENVVGDELDLRDDHADRHNGPR